MKRLTFSLLAVLLAGVALGQQANLVTPISVTKVVVNRFSVRADCSCAEVSIDYQSTTATNGTDSFRFSAGDGTLASFLTAIGSARTGETGSSARRMNFRILGFLSDNGLLTGVTLTP